MSWERGGRGIVGLLGEDPGSGSSSEWAVGKNSSELFSFLGGEKKDPHPSRSFFF